MTIPLITRFAPSPTGELHMGHAYAATVANHFAIQTGGKMILRIDDIDHTRCRDHFRMQIFDDLDWLGIDWHCSKEEPANPAMVPRQAHRRDAYMSAVDRLKSLGLVYPCYLSRRELADIITAPHDGPPEHRAAEQAAAVQCSGKTGKMLDTDQYLNAAEITSRQQAGQTPAWRLRMAAALEHAYEVTGGKAMVWFDHISGEHHATPEIFGDIVIARADIAVSYHLCVVVDDALDQITLVTRGSDLASSTHLHRLLQTLLGLSAPTYCHHTMICDATGKRLAKRDKANSLSAMRNSGETREMILAKMPPLPIP